MKPPKTKTLRLGLRVQLDDNKGSFIPQPLGKWQVVWDSGLFSQRCAVAFWEKEISSGRMRVL